MRNKFRTYLFKFRQNDVTMQVFPIVKFVSLMIPFVHSNTQLTRVLGSINIAEAITVDIIYKRYVNVILGLALACSLLLVESCSIFKLWCAFYFAWHVRFCLNRGWLLETAIGNNLPSLYVAITCASDDISVCVDKFGTCRVASILTQMISNALLGNL